MSSFPFITERFNEVIHLENGKLSSLYCITNEFPSIKLSMDIININPLHCIANWHLLHKSGVKLSQSWKSSHVFSSYTNRYSQIPFIMQCELPISATRPIEWTTHTQPGRTSNNSQAQSIELTYDENQSIEWKTLVSLSVRQADSFAIDVMSACNAIYNLMAATPHPHVVVYPLSFFITTSLGWLFHISHDIVSTTEHTNDKALTYNS